MDPVTLGQAAGVADDSITVKYRCPCIAGSQPVRVRKRVDDEDLLRWVSGVVMVAVGQDHARRSPQCKRGAVDLLLPAPPKDRPDAGIGTVDGNAPKTIRPNMINVEEIDG